MSDARGYAKAIVAFLVGGLTVAATALADNGITAQEWVWIALGALGTPAAVFGVPNKTDSRIQALDESMSHDPEAGEIGLGEALVFIAILFFLVWLFRAFILST